MSDSSIRKFIFEGELNNIFIRHELSGPQKDKIIGKLFENPYDNKKQLILKKDYKSLEKIRGELREIIDINNAVADLSALFIIDDDLKIPGALLNLFLNNEKVAVLVGAGVSKLIKLPLWNELADCAIKYLYDKNEINYFEYQKIIREIIDPKQKMSIFNNFFPKTSEKAVEIYRELLGKADRKANPYDLLVKFDWVKLTTNIDDEFYRALTQKPFPVDSSLSDNHSERRQRPTPNRETRPDISALNSDTIYPLHGYIEDIEETTLTTEDYIKAYYEDNSMMRKFLRKFFKEYTVIFIGYGLSEFSIMENVMKQEEKIHYALLDTYMNDPNVFRIQKSYLESLHIEPIPYYLDFNGYYRLNNVLSAWIKKIEEERESDYYENINKIDGVSN